MTWKETDRNNKIVPGMTFFYLTVISDTGKRTKNGNKIMKCKCVCGKEVERSTDCIRESLKHFCVISCGCKLSEWEKTFGKRLANDPKRVEETVKALGQVSGTTMQGIQRKKVNKNNNTGITGVNYMPRVNKYRARLMVCGKEVRSKYFDTLEEAAAYRKYLEKVFFTPFIKEYEAQTGHAYRDENGNIIKAGGNKDE